MSDVEQFWDALRAKWPHPTVEFKHLPREVQDHLIMGINMILSCLPRE